MIPLMLQAKYEGYVITNTCFTVDHIVNTVKQNCRGLCRLERTVMKNGTTAMRMGNIVLEVRNSKEQLMTECHILIFRFHTDTAILQMHAPKGDIMKRECFYEE
jgi:hypothetical protein